MAWLVKLVVGLALVGILVYDAASVMVNYVTLDSTADDIAVQLTTNSSAGISNPTELDARARDLAHEAGAHLVRVGVDDAGVLHVQVKRTAKTIVLRHIEPLRKWARAVVAGQAATN